MKTVLNLLVGILFFSTSAIAQISIDVEPDVKVINVEESQLNWTGKKVLGQHVGNIKISSGELVFTEGVLAGGSFSIDMGSINSTDLDGDMKGKLEGHLKSPDFFSVEEFPMAKLDITKVASMGTDGSYKVTADLTIKGITNPVKFYAQISDMSAVAEFSVDRSEYNVRYGSGSFFDNLGDNTIYDEFELSIDLKY